MACGVHELTVAVLHHPLPFTVAAVRRLYPGRVHVRVGLGEVEL